MPSSLPPLYEQLGTGNDGISDPANRVNARTSFAPGRIVRVLRAEPRSDHVNAPHGRYFVELQPLDTMSYAALSYSWSTHDDNSTNAQYMTAIPILSYHGNGIARPAVHANHCIIPDSLTAPVPMLASETNRFTGPPSSAYLEFLRGCTPTSGGDHTRAGQISHVRDNVVGAPSTAITSRFEQGLSPRDPSTAVGVLGLDNFIFDGIPPLHGWTGAVRSTRRDRSLEDRYKRVVSLSVPMAMNEAKYMWIDTICINQSSSSECFRAITAMRKWHSNAETVLAYLGSADTGVSTGGYPRSWFTRGWTLQELFAPLELSPHRTLTAAQWAWNCQLEHRAIEDRSLGGSAGYDTLLLSSAGGLSVRRLLCALLHAGNEPDPSHSSVWYTPQRHAETALQATAHLGGVVQIMLVVVFAPRISRVDKILSWKRKVTNYLWATTNGLWAVWALVAMLLSITVPIGSPA
ncbi:hypothetical protein LTR95_003575 [Oleoguttula sp. CCFEE 5521]